MKILSIFLTVLLLDPIVYFLLRILALYDNDGPLKAFGVGEVMITKVALPAIILFALYFFALLASVYLNIKKRYVANTIFLGLLIIQYFIIVRFFKLP